MAYDDPEKEARYQAYKKEHPVAYDDPEKEARYQQYKTESENPPVPIPDDAMGPSIHTPEDQRIQQKPPMMLDALQSVPESAYKEYIQPLTQIDALPEALGGLLRGSYHKFMGNKDEPSTKYVDAFIGEVTKPYQSKEALEKEFRENPMRLVDDASLALGVGGAGLKALGGMGRAMSLARSGTVRRGGEVLQKYGNAAATAGEMIDPITMPIKAFEMFNSSNKMKSIQGYTSAAKFPTKLSMKEKDALSETALKYELPLTREGVQRRDGMLEDLGGELNKHIEDSVTRGEVVPLNTLGSEMAGLKQKFSKFSETQQADLAQLVKRKKEFFEYFAGKGKTQLTMRDLQDFKTAQYERIKWDDKMVHSTYVDNEISKAFARAAKKKMDDMRPEIKDINTKYGELAELRPYHEKATSRISQNLSYGILDSMRSGAGLSTGAYIGHQLGEVFGIPAPVGGAIGGSGGYLLGKYGANQRYATNKGIPQVKNYNRRERSIMDNHPNFFAASHGSRSAMTDEEIIAKYRDDESLMP